MTSTGDDAPDGPPPGQSADDGDGDPAGASAGESATATADGSGTATTTLSVPDMDCASCADKVETALDGVDGVDRIEPAPASGRVQVSYDPDRADESALAGAVEGAGYEVTDAESDGDDRRTVWTSPRGIRTWVGALFLATGLAFVGFGSLANAAAVTVGPATLFRSDLLFVAAAAVAGYDILADGARSARALSLDIDFLMSTAILAAVTASVVAGEHLYLEAATLAVLFSVAELLETYAMDRARQSLRALRDRSPDTARVRKDGETAVVPVEDLAPGDVVVVRPGERIPVDGAVLAGESAVDEAAITGESVPVDKEPGDEVFAGTIAEGGYLEVEVEARGEETTISKIIARVEDAERSKTDREQFVDRFAGYYTPVMVALAIGVAAVPPLVFGGSWVRWFVAGITMLVLACPCAFVISTPVTVVSGITSAARNGVLIKGGRHLEAMGEVDTVAMDKTGTLTKGELAVTDVIPLDGRSEQEVLRCARGLEARSEHPVGEAIVEHAEAAAVDSGDVERFQNLAGRGVQASLDGVDHYAGKPALFEDLGFDLEHVHVVADGDGALDAETRAICEREGCLNLAADTIPRLQSEGKTVVLVGTADSLEGIIAVADEVRPDAARTVERLQAMGLDVVMLTGDNEGTARAVAEELGIDDYRAGLLPEDKVEAVEELAESGGVAMVGDGVNDAPALAAATVGIAMGAAGTDAAIETADVALLSDDVSKLPYLADLSRSANGVIRTNIWSSLGVKALLAVGVPLGYVGVAVAVLVGDAGMTIGVTGNALRLGRIRPDDTA